MMLGFPRSSTLKQARERKQQTQKHDEDDTTSFEGRPPPSSSRSSRSKRNSGMFDIGHTQLQMMKNQDPTQGAAVQRRTSKRASSQDRHGQVYGDEIPAFRPETPDVTIDLAANQTSPRGDDGLTISPRRDDPTRYELPHRDRAGASEQSAKPLRDNLSRPRTRTLEERIRSRSPQTTRADARKRIGSFQSVSHLPLQEDPNPGNSIGYPMIVSSSGQNSASTSRQRLIHTPPRPLSPAVPHSGALPSSSSPVSDAERILRLMRTTGGRMHGILYFRLSKSSVWQSGYCAINVGTGGLIYQTKGELAQTKTLIPDLRGCRVRTQYDPEAQAPFLEMSTRASGLGIHLRPLIPETFDSWLAALLCWQPLKPGGSQHVSSLHRQRTWRSVGSTSVSGNSTPTSSNPAERAPSRAVARPRPLTETYGHLRSSPAIKQSRVLWWDLSAPQSAPIAPPRRISTYKQMRMSAGTPWRKAVATIRENGLLEIALENSKDKEGVERPDTLKAAVDTGTLTRFAMQRLHASVLDDEFCLAIYTQYRFQPDAEVSEVEDDEGTSWPIFLSFENRSLFELWYTILRAFTVPEIYGPGAKALFGAGHAKPQEQHVELTSDMIRVKRSLQLRVIEAQMHAPKTNDQSSDSRAGSGEDWVIGDYHAEVQIDGETRGRTSLQTETSNPFWREDYEFNHLPPLTGHALIQVKSRQAGQRDWTLISDERYAPEDFRDADHLDMVEDIHISPLDSVCGTVELNLNEIERGADVEKWWPILNEYNEVVGRLFMRARLDEAVVLMSTEYEELGQLLRSFSNGVATDVMDKCNDSSGRLPEILLNIFQVDGLASRWIMTMVEDEIDSLQRDVSASRYRFSRRIASNDSYDSGVERELVLRDMGKSASTEANLLFRGNTPLTKALELHMRRLGKEYLEEVLGERMRDIDESEPECEVDPNKIHTPEALQRNWRNLILLTESIWRSISQSAHKCPPELRQLFRHIRACTEDRYGAFLRTVSYSSVSAFLFLRLLVPAILNPSLFGLLKEIPRPKSRRTLTMIAKSLQTLANMTTFGAKEPWMEPMNAFLNSHRQEFKDFIDDVCGISQERSAYGSHAPRDYAAAVHVLERLPPVSREGSPSLPYLLDQARDYATLVRFWLFARGSSGSIPIVNEDLARFDVICNRLRRSTVEVLTQAAKDGPVDVSGNDWQRLITQLDTSDKSTSGRRSGMASPTSPAPTPPLHEKDASSIAQVIRPQPTRASTTGSISTQNTANEPRKTIYGINLASESGRQGPHSPSADSYRDEGDDDDHHEDGDDPRPKPSAQKWGSVELSSTAMRDRAGTSPTSGSAGYIHPLAWSDPGSAGSGHSKASSLRSVEMEAVSGSLAGGDERNLNSSALPWSSNLAADEPGPSPMASPKDPESRRLVDILKFRRHEKKDKTDKDRDKERNKDSEKEDSKKSKKKEARDKKKQEKEQDRGRERGREDVGGTISPEEHRAGFDII